ncbi:MAG: prephenate dehydrogenase/arogenate dehydrogenase family protein [Candidatus Methylopumilus sp.]
MNKLVIFGVGLIGGSVALALKRQNAALHIVGVGRTGDSLQSALNLGVINEIESDVARALVNADMVIIAVPVAQTASIFSAIAPHLEPQTTISDVGSTKSDVIQHAQTLLGEKISQFVPGHPIAGAEKSGVTAAKADLFDGKNVVLTPTEQTSATAVNQVSTLWQLAGAKVSEMSSEQHDSIFAAVSHLPHLLAFALVDDLAARPNAKQLFDFAASGFRDFTRIAGSSPEMWRDISLANRTALLKELAAYQTELSRMQILLQNSDSAGLQSLFEQASQVRNAWADNREKLQK